MKKLLLVFVAVLAVATLSACSSRSKETELRYEWTTLRSIEDIQAILGIEPGDGEFEEGAPYTNTNVQGVTSTSIKVGNSAALTGGLAFVGRPFNDAMQAYFDMVNDDGGINGRMIEFIELDDEFVAAQGLSNIERLVETEEVFAIVGHFGTPTVGATEDYLTSIGIPRVYYATGISQLFNPAASGNERASFPVQPIFDAEGEVMVARAVQEYDAKKIGVIYTNADDGRGILAGVELRADILGVDLVTRQVDPAASDMNAAALALVAEGVDAIIVAANQVPAEVAIKALFEQGNTAPVFTSYVNAEASFIENLESEILSEMFPLYASAWVNIFEEDGVTLNSGYLEFAQQVPDLADNSFAMAGWIAAHFFVEGLNRVGENPLTWKSFVEAMESAPVENPMGGIVDFANGRRTGTQSMALLKARIYEVEIEDNEE